MERGKERATCSRLLCSRSSPRWLDAPRAFPHAFHLLPYGQEFRLESENREAVALGLDSPSPPPLTRPLGRSAKWAYMYKGSHLEE